MSPAVGSVCVSLRGEDGVVWEREWAAGAPDLGIARTVPWRTFRWRHGQQHYSGTYWSSVMSGHVIYESRLELTRLLYADFDRATEAVFAQPFLLSAQVDGRKRRHVPDFLILRRGRVPLVVDVKPRHLLTRPKVSFSLGWARETVESRGWEFEAWCEPPEAELANVRFLAGYRRAWLLDPGLLAEIRGAGLDGVTLGEAFRAFPRRPAELVRAAVLHLLWAQHLVTDLGTPLSARHRLHAGVPAEVTGAGTRDLPCPAADSGEGRMPEDGNAGSFDRGAYMGQAGARVGVGTRFAYDGEVVTVVEMFASAQGNELLVRDGRDRRFRLSLREALASGRARVIPEGPGPSSDEPREMASVVLGQLTAQALKEVRERAADVNEVLSGYRSGSEELAGRGEPRRTFGVSGKRRRDIAGRPVAVYGKLRPTRPGEYLLMDTTRLDVFALDQLTFRWVQPELSVAMDWYSRCITGIRVTPVSTKSVDIAATLFQAYRPRPAGADWPAHAAWPDQGIPRGIVLDRDAFEGPMAEAARQGGAASPALVPETLVVDYADPPVMPMTVQQPWSRTF